MKKKDSKIFYWGLLLISTVRGKYTHTFEFNSVDDLLNKAIEYDNNKVFEISVFESINGLTYYHTLIN
jgi:hypothetical protein